MVTGKGVVEPEVHHEKEFDLIYVTGQIEESREIILPLIKDSSISMNHISAIQKQLFQKHGVLKYEQTFPTLVSINN